MSTLAITCNQCGGPLSVPERVRFVTCTYCHTQLKVTSEGGAAYTEILDQIHSNTERISDRLDAIEQQNEVEQLDREWMMERDRLATTTREGRRVEPSEGGSLIGAIVTGVFGLFWTGMAVNMNAPGFFPLFGVLFVGLAIYTGVHGFGRAGEYQRRKREYERKRRRLLSGDEPRRG